MAGPTPSPGGTPPDAIPPDGTPHDGTPPDGTSDDGTARDGASRATGLRRVRAWRWRLWVTRSAELIVLIFAVSLGGVSATSLFPTTVETDNFRAEVRLSALPTFTSTIHSPTSFGDLDLEFTSRYLAPGVDATVQVRESITDLFDDRRLSIDSLQPTGKEVNDAIGSGVTELALKYAGGVLVVGIAAIAVIAYARRRRPTARQAVSVGVASLLAIGATGIGISQTYQPGQLSRFRTTGLLSTVRSNAGLLAGVEARAQQATPYVTNLLALSAALQENFTPTDPARPPAARFLLVSDIHGANQYPLMKRIVQEEKITAVIDSGDLINLGSVTEAELAGLFASIRDLRVPYIFVRGNHDANSLSDQALLRRMATIPNVVLLEPTPQSYTQLAVNGVVLAGFNDPRFFGDDSKNMEQKQRPAADAFNRAYAGRARPDIVVTHEPVAARMVASATVVVNGHLHKDEIEGNRIGVGTFTGGGTLSHFLLDKQSLLDQQSLLDRQRLSDKQRLDKQSLLDRQGAGKQGADNADDPSGELPGQPYAFDIAAYGQDCELTSLTRYTFRNLIQGRPAYDDVSVINGRTIAGREPDGRTCAADLGMIRTTVTVGP
jgi:predicted phosphodiesterase